MDLVPSFADEYAQQVVASGFRLRFVRGRNFPRTRPRLRVLLRASAVVLNPGVLVKWSCNILAASFVSCQRIHRRFILAKVGCVKMV